MNTLKNRAKERFINAKEELRDTVCGIKNGVFPNISKGDKIATCIVAMGTTFAFATEQSFAAIQLFESVKKMVADNYTEFLLMIVSLAAFLATAALLVWFFFPSDDGSKMGKKWFIRILLCIAVLLSLGGIFGAIFQATESMRLDIGNLNIN